jgi:hypothetical protein
MKKVRFRRALSVDRYAESLALTLIQPRQDGDGNRLQGYTAEALLAMTPVERQRLKAMWLSTEEVRCYFEELLRICR